MNLDPGAILEKIRIKFLFIIANFASYRDHLPPNHITPGPGVIWFGGKWTEYWRRDDDSCPPIYSSSSGVNYKGIEEPETPSAYDSAIPFNEFHAFVRENQMNSLRRDDMAHFVDLMRNSVSSDVFANYTTIDSEEEFY